MFRNGLIELIQNCFEHILSTNLYKYLYDSKINEKIIEIIDSNS